MTHTAWGLAYEAAVCIETSFARASAAWQDKTNASPKCGTRTHGALTDDSPALDPTRGVELPNICKEIYIYICVSVSLDFFTCIYLFMYLSIFYLFICVVVYLFIYLFIC